MSLIMIALIKRCNKNIGIRLLDSESKQIKDIPYENVVSVLKIGNVTIDNLEVVDNQLKGTNGDISRYAVIEDGVINPNKNKVVILYKEDNKFICTNGTGKIIKVDEKRLVEYSKKIGLANGKIVKNSIRSIKGEYNTINTSISNKRDYKINIVDNVCVGIEPSNYSGDIVISGAETIIIPEDAFNKNNFNTVTILGNNIIVGDNAFLNCNLNKLKIEANNLEINRYSFDKKTSLKEVYIKAKTGFIGVGAFENTGIVKLYCDIKTIKSRAFKYCKDLKDVKLSVRYIYNEAFYGTKSLKELTLKNVSLKDSHIFEESGLEKLVLERCTILGITNMYNLKELVLSDSTYLKDVNLKFDRNIDIKVIGPLKEKSRIAYFKCSGHCEKVNVYISSAEYGYSIFSNLGVVQLNIINTINEDEKSKLEKLSSSRLALLGTDREGYFTRLWENEIKRVESGKITEIPRNNKYNCKGIDLELREDIKSLIRYDIGREVCEVDDDIYNLILNIIMRLPNKLKKEEYKMFIDSLCNEDGKRYFNIESIITKNQYILYKYNDKFIVTIDIKIGNNKNKLLLCISRGKIDYIHAFDYCNVSIGAKANYDVSIPIEHLDTTSYFCSGHININGLDNNRTKMLNLGAYVINLIAESCIKIDIDDYSIIYNRFKDKALLVKGNILSYYASIIDINDIEKLDINNIKLKPNSIEKEIANKNINYSELSNELDKNKYVRPQSKYCGTDIINYIKRKNIRKIEDIDSNVVLNLDKLFNFNEIQVGKSTVNKMNIIEEIEVADNLKLKHIESKRYKCLGVYNKEGNLIKLYTNTIVIRNISLIEVLRKELFTIIEESSNEIVKLSSLYGYGWYIDRGSKWVANFYIGYKTTDNKMWIVYEVKPRRRGTSNKPIVPNILIPLSGTKEDLIEFKILKDKDVRVESDIRYIVSILSKMYRFKYISSKVEYMEYVMKKLGEGKRIDKNDISKLNGEAFSIKFLDILGYIER